MSTAKDWIIWALITTLVLIAQTAIFVSLGHADAVQHYGGDIAKVQGLVLYSGESAASIGFFMFATGAACILIPWLLYSERKIAEYDALLKSTLPDGYESD